MFLRGVAFHKILGMFHIHIEGMVENRLESSKVYPIEGFSTITTLPNMRVMEERPAPAVLKKPR